MTPVMAASLWFASREACEAVASLAYFDAARATVDESRDRAPVAVDTDAASTSRADA